MIVVAFDPGKVASWARYDTVRPWDIEMGELEQIGRGRLLRPCPIHLAELVKEADMAIVEEVGAMKEQGVSSMFTFGLCVGSILGALSACDKPIALVMPQEWKKATRLSGMGRDNAKIAARHYAKELWPATASLMNVKKNHGMAEAALMARWFFLQGPGADVELKDNVPVKVDAKTLTTPDLPPEPEKPPKKPRAKRSSAKAKPAAPANDVAEV
ncbi:MAG: hypothetical protein ABJN42_29130 [Roseibium sp.]|uniref:hypothetical protein n=1 Tax=Roseibium sp. TaxID=1936156 RepID=UPI003298E154